MSVATVFLAPVDAMIKFYTGDPIAVVSELIREDRYQKIGALQTDEAGEDACEEMFDLSNNPCRQSERNLRWGNYRSLSVGDVVHVDGRSWLCCATGWRELT